METPLCLEVVLCEMYTGIHLARNSVRAHFDHFKELWETECDYNSGYFSRKYSGSTCLLPFFFFFSLIMRLTYSEYQQESAHLLATPCKRKCPHQLERKGSKTI